MYDFNLLIERELSQVDFLIASYERKPKVKIEGGFVCRRRKGELAYFVQKRVIKEGTIRKCNKFIGNEFDPKVQKIKASRFNGEMLKRLVKDRKLLEKMKDKFQDYKPCTIVKALPQAYRDLPDQCFTDERLEELKSWAAERYRANGHDFPKVANITVTGEKVRSKGEVIIYNMLVYYGIPFRYECRLDLVNEDGTKETRYPDFVIELADGSLLIWEHAGGLGDAGYFDIFCNKLKLYYNNGITLGDNLIVTADKKGSTMNAEVADAIIKEYILPRVKTLS